MTTVAVSALLAAFAACTTTGPTGGAPRGPGFVELLARTTADAGAATRPTDAGAAATP